MAVKASVTLENVDKVINNLKNIERRKTANVTQTMQTVAFHMEGKIKESVAGRAAEPRSVDTGLFLRSIIGTAEHLTATIMSLVSYSKELEFGTSKKPPRSHFRNSLAREKTAVTKFIKDAIQK